MQAFNCLEVTRLTNGVKMAVAIGRKGSVINHTNRKFRSILLSFSPPNVDHSLDQARPPPGYSINNYLLAQKLFQSRRIIRNDRRHAHLPGTLPVRLVVECPDVDMQSCITSIIHAVLANAIHRGIPR